MPQTKSHHANAAIIEAFYKSFQQLDANGMKACYHPDIEFSDPVFPNLTGDAAGAMWTMLCKRAENFHLTYSDISADETSGTAQWQAQYKFSATGRKVHNIITANFEFKDGKIIKHNDHFNFWRWSRMALGVSGVLLGWTPLLQNKVRATANQNLQIFMRQNG